MPQFQNNIYVSALVFSNTDTPTSPLVKQNPPRQAVMTPNNLIHELGHSLDSFSGFGFKKIGSLLNAIDNPVLSGSVSLHGGYSRNGMGPAHLRVQFYEHADIIPGAGMTADFSVLAGKTPATPVREQYLLFDLLDDDRYMLWQQPFYTNLYGNYARIDTFGINPATTAIETVADAFLSWVRNVLVGSEGQAWRSFFESPQNNIGLFLRNAVFYGNGNVQFYKSVGKIAETPIVFGSRVNGVRVRIGSISYGQQYY